MAPFSGEKCMLEVSGFFGGRQISQLQEVPVEIAPPVKWRRPNLSS